MKKVFSLLDGLLKIVICLCVFTIFVLALVQVFGRLISSAPTWINEVCRLMLVVTVFFGAALCVREKRHVKVDFLNNILPKKANVTLDVLVDILVLAFSVLLVYSGYRFAMRNMAQILPATKLPKGVVYCVIPVSGFIMCINSIRNIWETVETEFLHRREIKK